MGWFGRDLIRDLTDPYHKVQTPGENITHDYFGYFDIWGLKDFGNDVLGSGPADRDQRAARRGQEGLSARRTCPRSRTSAAGSTSGTCSGSCPTTTSTGSRTCGSSSRSPTSPTATSSKNTTSG